MKKLLWGTGVLLFLGFVITLITFTVNVTEYAVVTQFGRPVKTIEQAGLNFKWPLPVQRVNRLDRRLQLFESKLIEFLTKDKKNIVIKCYVGWEIAEPMIFFQSVGTIGVAQQKLEDIMIARGGAAIGDFDFEDLISIEKESHIGDLEGRIRSNLEQQTLRDYGIRIMELGISQLALPEANAFSVYSRMRAERQAIANKYRAEGQEQAAIIRAEADTKKSAILSKAYQEAQVIMGEGEAEASKIYAEAFSKDPEFYKFWRTMETYRKIMDEKTTLILSEESELFKYLRE
ncbi:protease modulator HflC [Acidobacteriota bacterium]